MQDLGLKARIAGWKDEISFLESLWDHVLKLHDSVGLTPETLEDLAFKITNRVNDCDKKIKDTKKIQDGIGKGYNAKLVCDCTVDTFCCRCHESKGWMIKDGKFVRVS